TARMMVAAMRPTANTGRGQEDQKEGRRRWTSQSAKMDQNKVVLAGPEAACDTAEVERTVVVPTDRPILAMFIEYAAPRRVTPSEWQGFAVQHYGAERMEVACRECVRLLLWVARGRLTWNA